MSREVKHFLLGSQGTFVNLSKLQLEILAKAEMITDLPSVLFAGDGHGFDDVTGLLTKPAMIDKITRMLAISKN
jgi:hypothetical protein